MRTIVFGIRKSKLAGSQLDEFIAYLAEKKVTFKYTLKTIVTQGDKNRTSPLQNFGQGIFVKEIERALLRREIDCAVHSLKDMPVKTEKGTVLSCFAPRRDARDCLTAREGISAERLKGLRVGTGSPRRSAFLKEIEPEVEIMPLRGNVDTRLRKMDKGDYDAVVLASCGLKRLGLEKRICRYFDPDAFVPAASQGIIASQTRADDAELNYVLRECSSPDTEQAAVLERKVLEALGIGCHVPFGVYARFNGNVFTITAKAHREKSPSYIYERRECSRPDQEKAVADLIEAMKAYGQ